MPTNIGLGYEAQLVDQVLQVRTIGSATWQTVDSPVTEAKYRTEANGTTIRLDYYGPWSSNGSNAPWTVPAKAFSTTNFTAVRGGSTNDWTVDAAQWSTTLAPTSSTPTPTPAPSGPVSTIETTLSMSGHQIIDGLPATTPSGFVVLSQLTELSQALTTVINAGDAAVQADIDALEVVVANLPAGLTMAQVQTAIDAAVAEAVLNEVIDDAQKQAIVDAALAQLSTIDTAVIDRVGAAEAILASLEPRVAALETLTATHTDQIAAGVTKDASQDAAIAAVEAGVAGAVAVNNAQETRLGNIESAAAIVNQAITPVVVNLSAGAVTSAVGVALGDVSIDNSNTTHMSVTVNLGASNAGKRRVATAFRVINGVEEEFGCSKVRSGESYVFSFLKTRASSTAVTLVLN